MNAEDLERAMDAQHASSWADVLMAERGFPLADLVEPVPADFLTDLLDRLDQWADAR